MTTKLTHFGSMPLKTSHKMAMMMGLMMSLVTISHVLRLQQQQRLQRPFHWAKHCWHVPTSTRQFVSVGAEQTASKRAKVRCSCRQHWNKLCVYSNSDSKAIKLHRHTDTDTIIIITMYIYHALINAMSAHMLHINLNMILYTHVEHSPTKTIYIKYYILKNI